MQKFLSMILPLSALAMAVPVGAAGLSANMTQASFGSGEIALTNIAAVCVEELDACNVPGSFQAPDEAGRGIATVVTYDANPGWFAGKQICITGVGDEWSAAGGRVDPARVQCAPIAAGRATIPFQVNGSGVFGIVPLIVDHGQVIAWGSHPFGPSRYMMTRPGGRRDVITLLASDGGRLRAATEAEASKYRELYASLFRQSGPVAAERYDAARRAVENH
jgi:hypothetical protein